MEKLTASTGYKLVEEYKASLLDYLEDGHGEMLVLVSELQGFLDCLIRLALIKEEDYMYIIDCFRAEAKAIRER